MTVASLVAHEVNNPLVYVLANLDLVAEQLANVALDPSPERIRELLDTLGEAREGADRVRSIVRDLKAFSRRDAEHRVPVDVRSALETSIRMTGNEIRHRARLTRAFDEVPAVLADESRLCQVFINLLLNAAQAIREGNADRNEIRVVARTDASGRVVVEVRDTGSGVPAAVAGKVFDPFFTTKPAGVGTGLGLSVCHGIVTALGGRIGMAHEPGWSTTFRVVLPPAGPPAAPAAPVPPDPNAAAIAPRRGRILVVDDDPMVCRVIRRVLRDHELTTVTSASAALAELDGGGAFDLVLSDLMMPERTGIDLHTELSRRRPDLARGMVFMTGGAFTDWARSFLDDVPNERIEKPFDVRSLRALVDRLLSAR